MTNFGKGKVVCLPVEFNDRGQPIGENAAKFASCLGVTARELVPVTVDDWKHLSDDFKKQIWEHLKQKFVLDDCRKGYAFKKMARIWGNFRCLLVKVMKKGKNVGLQRATILLKPDNVQSMEEWQAFIHKRTTPEYKEKCEKFKKMRQNQDLLHTTSRKGFARLEDEMRRASDNPDDITRTDVFVAGYTSKNGGYRNEKTKEIVEKVKEYQTGEASLGTCSLNEDGVSKVLGPERRGRVRGLGFGANPSKVGGQKHNCGKVNQLEREVEILKNTLANVIAKVDGMMNNNDQSGDKSDQASPDVGMSNTRRPHNGIFCGQNSRNLEGSKCKLLHWMTGQVVAIAEIASVDPNALVHGIPMGNDCWKVWVLEVLDIEVTLYRPTREFFLLSEALSSTIMWPIKFIKLESV